MKYLITLAVLFLSITIVEAHSWYPLVCCGGQDCHPIPCQELIENAKGYTYHGIQFLKEQIQPSLNAQCHVCISNEVSPMTTPVPHCAFIQLGE